MTYVLNGEPLVYGYPFTVGETQHPANILDLWSREDLAGIGVVWVEPELTFEEEREALFVRIGDNRREASQRLTFAGMSIFLDAKTEDAIHKAIKGLERSPAGTVVKFEIRPGYNTAMDLIWMEALGDAAFALVQACFDHLANLCDLAWAAETVEDLRAIDITTGWP